MNGSDDYGSVVLPADPRLLEMADRVLDEIPPGQRGQLVIRDQEIGARNLRSFGQESGRLRASRQHGLVTDTNGRSAPAELVAAAKRYVEASGSPVLPFELALAAAHDERLRGGLLEY